jgi:hypothetical protein
MVFHLIAKNHVQCVRRPITTMDALPTPVQLDYCDTAILPHLLFETRKYIFFLKLLANTRHREQCSLPYPTSVNLLDMW